MTETGMAIAKERVGELQTEEQGSWGFKPLKTKAKCRCWEAGWLHNSGKLVFTQTKPAGLLERLCVFGAEALLLSFVSVHSGVRCLCLCKEHECNCCGVKGAGVCEGGSSCFSFLRADRRTKEGEWRMAPSVDATGHAVSREDRPRPSLLTQGQTRRHEPWVPLKQMFQPPSCPRLPSPSHPKSHRAPLPLTAPRSLIKFK